MSVTAKLLRLYKVDRQLRSLRSRINQAQRYVDAQDRQLGEIAQTRASVESQLRQTEASTKNDENEIASIDERIEALRERLNTMTTSKEYSATLTEMNTLKADKALIEERTLELMGRSDELRASLAELAAQTEEREKIKGVAISDLKKREEEAAERITELEGERAIAAEDVPVDALAAFDELAEQRDEDEVMTAIEEHSRRHMEYACGCCQTILPLELINRLCGHGDLTTCVNCGAILYAEADIKDALTPTSKK